MMECIKYSTGKWGGQKRQRGDGRKEKCGGQVIDY